MSERQNVTTPVGSAAAQPARSRSTSSPGVFGRRAGSRRHPEPDRGLELLGLRAGRCPPSSGRTPAGAAPVSSANAVAASA